MRKKRYKRTDTIQPPFLFSEEEMLGILMGNDPKRPTVSLSENQDSESPAVCQQEMPGVGSLTDCQQESPATPPEKISIKDAMSEALDRLRSMPLNDISAVAMKCAVIIANENMTPSNNEDKGSVFHISEIGDTPLGYNRLVGYQYASFYLAYPQMLDKINLPYHDDFQQVISSS